MSTKVLLISNNFPPIRGGSAVVYHNLASVAGGRIDVLAPRISYVDGRSLAGWREHDRKASYRVFRLRLLRTLLCSSGQPSVWQRLQLRISDLAIRCSVISKVLLLVAKERYSAVCLGELVASGWMILPLRRLLGLHVLVYLHGEEITTRDSYDPERRKRRRYLQQVNSMIVVSRFTETAVRELLGDAAARGKVVLIRNGVANSRFVPGPKRPDLVAKHGLEDAFVFLTVCRLLEKKGVDNALRAFAAILDQDSQEGPTVRSRFLVVGSGPYQSDLTSLSERLGIADSVIFTGLVPEDDLVDYYRLGDVFVMPNRRLPDGDTEGFGLVFLEANGCGLPVVAGRDGGSTDAVEDGVNGLVVDGMSVPEIATAMKRLRDDPELRQKLGRGGLAITAAAGWEQKAEQLLELLSPVPRAC